MYCLAIKKVVKQNELLDKKVVSAWLLWARLYLSRPFFDIFPWIILLTSQSELQWYKQGPAAAT